MSKGLSARATCPTDILLQLSNREMGFEELVTSLQQSYARGTINEYLNELYDNGLVSREGRRGKYRLTSKGKQKAEREKTKRNIGKYVDSAKLEDVLELKKTIERQQTIIEIKDFEILIANCNMYLERADYESEVACALRLLKRAKDNFPKIKQELTDENYKKWTNAMGEEYPQYLFANAYTIERNIGETEEAIKRRENALKNECSNPSNSS